MSDTEEPQNRDEPDPELIELAGTGNRPSVLRPILMIAVIALGAWIISDWRVELEYFFSGDEPVELGDALDFAIGSDGEGREAIPHNRYVSISGIPTQRSQSTRYRFFRLIGAPIFVEQKRDDYIEDPIQRELEGDTKGEIDRTMYDGRGRIMQFAQMPDRYRGLRHYYRTRYNIVFCEELDERQYAEMERRKRDAIISQWRAEFEEAPEEARAARGLTPDPTDDEVAELLADDPVCIDAWLLQDGAEPRDHWWYVLAALMFALFMAFNAVMLVRWFIAFARS